MPARLDECTVRHLIISPREIHYLRFLLEAYEGIAVLTTIDPKLGHVVLHIAPGCEQEVEHILESERHSLRPRSVLATGGPPKEAAMPGSALDS
jgi:hypothetical protein